MSRKYLILHVEFDDFEVTKSSFKSFVKVFNMGDINVSVDYSVQGKLVNSNQLMVCGYVSCVKMQHVIQFLTELPLLKDNIGLYKIYTQI